VYPARLVTVMGPVGVAVGLDEVEVDEAEEALAVVDVETVEVDEVDIGAELLSIYRSSLDGPPQYSF
jgi:hypothetical protein